jgi:hypothetical protein
VGTQQHTLSIHVPQVSGGGHLPLYLIIIPIF